MDNKSITLRILKKSLLVGEFDNLAYASGWCILEKIYKMCEESDLMGNDLQSLESIFESSDCNQKLDDFLSTYDMAAEKFFNLYFRTRDIGSIFRNIGIIENKDSILLKQNKDLMSDIYYNTLTLDNGRDYYIVADTYIDDKRYSFLICPRDYNNIMVCEIGDDNVRVITDEEEVKKVVNKLYRMKKMLF